MHFVPHFVAHFVAHLISAVSLAALKRPPRFSYLTVPPCRIGDILPQMPLGNVFIPEGWLRITQRFNVGIGAQGAVSPEGTAENPRSFSRPFGTYGSLCSDPNVELKRWAILSDPSGMKTSPSGIWGRTSPIRRGVLSQL